MYSPQHYTAPQTGQQDTAVSQPSYATLSSYSSESAFYEDTQYHHSTRPSVIVDPSLGPLYDTTVPHSHQTPESNLDCRGATANVSASAPGSYGKVYDRSHQNIEAHVYGFSSERERVSIYNMYVHKCKCVYMQYVKLAMFTVVCTIVV